MASTVRDWLFGASSKAAKVATFTAVMSGVFVGGTQLAARAQAPITQPPADASGATRAVEQSDSPIGIAAGQALMSRAESAIASQNYSQAAADLVAARKALNEVSTYYQNLAGVFVGVDSRVNSSLREKAIEAAQIRDQASYQLAVVYRAQGQPNLAVPLLVEVSQSQQPTRPLGQQAYQQLYELGFVSVPYDAPGGRSRSTSREPEPEVESDEQPIEDTTEVPVESEAPSEAPAAE